jgi:Predicted membrane protein
MAKPPRVKSNSKQESLSHTARQTIAVSHEQWSGPLPPPEALARFNDIVPNGAERVFKMAEDEQAHRIASENTGLIASIAEAKRGQLLGASISIVFAYQC